MRQAKNGEALHGELSMKKTPRKLKVHNVKLKVRTGIKAGGTIGQTRFGPQSH